jgi:iron complex transport system ATP-binding protein
MISVQNIHYKISPYLSLEDISFEAKAGEFTVILGANGAGKSTLLKVITGALKNDSGSVLLNNKSIHQYKSIELAKISAVLQQQNNLQLPYVVSEVVMMGRYPHFKRVETENDLKIVSSTLEKTGVAHLADRNYLTLSGGEQQRVQLARVLAQIHCEENEEGRKCLFMDEPSNNLDIKHQHNVLNIAKSFSQDGHCVLAVLHDLNLALQYADKIVMLNNGKLIGYGTPKEVITNEMISEVYEMPMKVFTPEGCNHPMVMPITA